MIPDALAATRRRGDRAAFLPSRGSVAALIVGLALGAGCGRHAGPVVQFVEGLVLLDGQPLEGATVGLSPVEGSPGLPAYARTDARGVFRVTSTRGGRRDAGAAAGDYIVTIEKVVAEDAPEVEDDEKRSAAVKKPARAASRRQPWNVVPGIYGETETSPLRATIQSGRNVGSAFVFDLKTDGTSSVAPRR